MRRAAALLLLAACGEGAAGEEQPGGGGDGGGGSGPAPAEVGALCDGDAACRSGRCEGFLCVEPCGSCAGHCEVVGDGVGVCGPALGAADLELGPVATDAEGRSVELELELPDGLASFTLLAVDDDGLRVAIRRLVAPDGTVLVDLDDEEEDLCPVRPYPGASGVLVPNTDDPRASPRGGTYRVTLGSYDPTIFDSLAPVAGGVERLLGFFVKRGAEGGTVDLTLHFSPATGIAAEGAGDHPFVRELMDRTRELLLAQAQLRVGDVAFADLDPEEDVVEDGPEARALCKVRSTPGRVDVFVVSQLSFTTGFTGGIPGPPGVAGTAASGIVLQLLGSGGDTGILLAHELGHFLGLFHTTELQGGGRDPLSDTPWCEAGTEIHDCADYGDLMFPVFPLDPGLTLTPAQAAVTRRSALLREVERPLACPEAAFCTDATSGFATGDTRGLAGRFEGTCGGAGAPDAVQLVRLLDGSRSLEVVVTGVDFAPIVHVRRGDCTDATAELACAGTEAGTGLQLILDRPGAGAYFVIVDGRDGGSGSYVLQVNELL